jgi:hypothetical protein
LTHIIDKDVDLADLVNGVLYRLIDFGVILYVDGMNANVDIKSHGLDLCPHSIEFVLRASQQLATFLAHHVLSSDLASRD